MENKFKQVMSERTDEELIKILTTERDGYNPMAIEAAELEVEMRNIDTTEIKQFKEQAKIKKEQKEKDLQRVIVKNYTGKHSEAIALFKRDAIKMAEKGYYPTSQNWTQGAYGCGSFILALLLCIVLIGIIVFIYMLIVKPDGTLSVTYELEKENTDVKYSSSETLNEKECPQCAEKVKEKAKICRFCRYEFKK